MGKFSSVLRVLWLTEAVIYLQRTNHSLLSFNAVTQCKVILVAPQQHLVGDILLFFKMDLLRVDTSVESLYNP